MNLKSVPDAQLLSEAKHLATEERRIGIAVLHHLQEIDSRKLYAALGFSSLFQYCVKELSYSEGGAYRRISAMKLLREVPQYESKLKAGAVTVATLSKVQSFLVQEKRLLGKKYSKDDKLKLLATVEGKSAKQTDRVLATLSPELPKPDKETILNDREIEVRFTTNPEVMRKLERLKNILGHQSKFQTYSELFEKLADIALRKLDPLEKPTKLESGKLSPKTKEPHLGNSKNPFPPVETDLKKNSGSPRYVSAETKYALWRREVGRCSFVDPKTRRRCFSRHALQIEHIVPFAKGGTSKLENLTLLCPSHNQYRAIQAYGLAKMRRFWERDRSSSA